MAPPLTKAGRGGTAEVIAQRLSNTMADSNSREEMWPLALQLEAISSLTEMTYWRVADPSSALWRIHIVNPNLQGPQLSLKA